MQESKGKSILQRNEAYLSHCFLHMQQKFFSYVASTLLDSGDWSVNNICYFLKIKLSFHYHLIPVISALLHSAVWGMGLHYLQTQL